MQLTEKIFIAGHNGMAGSAILRKLKEAGYCNLILRSSIELDLRNQKAVNEFFKKMRPDHVLIAAAREGGIMANHLFRAQFIYDNLMIQSNLIHYSHMHQVKKLLFMGSSCIYPRACPQPIKEEYLLTGPLEHTNEPYALAKISGIKMCEAYREQYGCNFISVTPANLYGLNDNYDLYTSQVIPSLIRKFHEAKICGRDEVMIWGSGRPVRDFLHADDLADACIHLMNTYNDPGLVNIGTGTSTNIYELACLIKEVVGYNGTIRFDEARPDGLPSKLPDISKLQALGWQHSIELEEGLRSTYVNFKNIHYAPVPRKMTAY